jgi:hypothetical protein
VLPKGVAPDQLVSSQPLDVSKTFERKNNKATLMFTIGACALGALLIIALVWVIFFKQAAVQ